MPLGRAVRVGNKGVLVSSIVLSLSARTAPLGAQPTPDEARAAYEQGLVHLTERRYHEAAAALERSDRLRALPVVTYNLALAYRGLGRYVAAVQAFERYLLAPEPGAPEERLAAVRAELEELRGRLVRVLARVTPPEATLTLDGRPVARIAQGGDLVLDPGPHVLTWSARDHRDARRELPGGAGTAYSLEVRLEPIQDGRLVVEPTPSEAVVTVDGRRLGAGRQDLGLAPGEHQVELRASGRVTVRRAVRVGSTGVARLSVALEREPLPGWVIPTAVVGGTVLLGTVVTLMAIFLAPEVPDPRQGTWDSVAP